MVEALDIIDRLGQVLMRAHQVDLPLRPEAAAILMTANALPSVLLNSDEGFYSSGIAMGRSGWVAPPERWSGQLVEAVLSGSLKDTRRLLAAGANHFTIVFR